MIQEIRIIVSPEGKSWVARVEGLESPIASANDSGRANRLLIEAITKAKAEGKLGTVQKAPRRPLKRDEQELTIDLGNL